MIEATLTQRARRLFYLTVLAAASVLGGFAWLGWELMLALDARRTAQELEALYRHRVARELAVARVEAERLAAEIEFVRLAEGDATHRSARLTAYFAQRGEHERFAATLIATASGLPVFGRGCPRLLQECLDRVLMLPTLPEVMHLDIHCEDSGHVYVVFARNLWLGQDGQGRILLGQALNHGWLKRLADPGHRLFLYYSGQRKAASEGTLGMQTALDLTPRSDPRVSGGELQAEISLGANAPILVLRAPYHPLVPATTMALATVATTGLLLSLLWLLLGRRLERHAERMQALAQAARVFRNGFQRAASQTHLSGQLTRRDELGELARDLDALMQEAERRQEQEQVHTLTLALLEEAVLDLDLEGRLLSASPAWRKLAGRDAPSDARLDEYLDAEDQPAWNEMLRSLAKGEKGQVSARLRLKTDSEDERWVELQLARRDTAEGETHLSGVARDITQHYLQERRITHMALHDALTGLPNRILLEDRIKMALILARRDGKKVAMGFIDLDQFKHVNDTLGHKTGDALLVALAARLRQNLREGDTLARWGGDEFVVLLPGMPHIEAVREVMHKLAEAVRSPLMVEEAPFNVTFSAGIAIYPDDAKDIDTLLAQADRAMFYAKAQGRNHLQLYADMTQKGLGKKEIYIQQRLVAAVREGRIQVYYQPIVRARDGLVVGVEALARWHEQELGWVGPATFIPMAENLGLMRELGDLVWRQALSDMARLQAAGQSLFLAVNISRRQLFAAYFTENLCKDLAQHGLTAADIVLEITESTAMLDVEHAFERLEELARAGFRLAIDDFGTGYSSLAQLHEMHAHELKIDLSFVRRIHTPEGVKLIEAIVSMAHSLGLTAVAEGVEDEASVRKLAEMGVDLLQGYHFGRPMPVQALGSLLDGRSP